MYPVLPGHSGISRSEDVDRLAPATGRSRYTKITMRAEGRTDPGLVREENQDVFAVCEELGVALLADGVARPRAGRIAAQVAVETALEHLLSVGEREPLQATDLRRALEIANDRVFGLSAAVSSYRGMATTLVATAVLGAKGYVAHVGDSRAYLFRDGSLRGITKDHSVVQDRVDAGLISPREARYSSDRHIVTRAIGAEPTLRADVRELDLAAEDLLLLCSDGLTEHLQDDEIASRLDTTDDLSDVAQDLVDSANRAGGTDNVTVVLVRC